MINKSGQLTPFTPIDIRGLAHATCNHTGIVCSYDMFRHSFIFPINHTNLVKMVVGFANTDLLPGRSKSPALVKTTFNRFHYDYSFSTHTV